MYHHILMSDFKPNFTLFSRQSVTANAPEPTSLQTSQPTQAHHDPFNDSVHLIHAPGAKKAPTQTQKPIAASSASKTSQPTQAHHHHHLHEPFNAYLIHTFGAAKQLTSAPKQKPATSHSTEPSEHLGRSVGHCSQHVQFNMNPVETPELNLRTLFAEIQPQSHMKAHSSQPRKHLNRSFGHRGHPAQRDLSPVEGPKYDIEGSSHHQQNDKPILPFSWFIEPTSVSISQRAPATLVQQRDSSTHHHNENHKRRNSNGHHAHAMPAHRDHKPRHNHDNNDATDKRDHFRHQPHDQNCGNDYHDQFGNLRASAASDSPLLMVRKLFSAGNSSGLGYYTYSEAVTHKRRPRMVTHKRRPRMATLSASMKKRAAL